VNLATLRQGVEAHAIRLAKPIPTPLRSSFHLNQAGQEFMRETQVRRLSQTFDVQANVSTYTLSGLILDVPTAYHNGIALTKTSISDLDAQGTDWRAAKGKPEWYFMQDPKTFRPWPTPDTALVAGFVADVIRGWDTNLSADADDPEAVNGLPAKYHHALIFRAVWEMFGEAAMLVRYQELAALAIADASKEFSSAASGPGYRYL